MSLAKNLLAIAVTAAFAAPALADDVTFQDYANGSQAIDYTLFYGDSNSANKTGSAGAGGFKTLINGQSFVTYCIDLYQTISFGTTYTDYSPVSPLTAAFFTNPNGLNAISRFLAEGHGIGNSIDSAAFQVAIWELMYETSGTYDVRSTSLAKGSAFFSGSSEVLDRAQSWISVLDAATTPFSVYQSRTAQDIVVTPVPEPETYALMAAGLGALGWVARRRKAKDAAKA